MSLEVTGKIKFINAEQVVSAALKRISCYNRRAISSAYNDGIHSG
jgi:hypothetical protein